MRIEVTELFRVTGRIDAETGRPVPDYTLPVGFIGEFVKEGRAAGLLGVEDGEHIYVGIKESHEGRCADLFYVPGTKARLVIGG